MLAIFAIFAMEEEVDIQEKSDAQRTYQEAQI